MEIKITDKNIQTMIGKSEIKVNESGIEAKSEEIKIEGAVTPSK